MKNLIFTLIAATVVSACVANKDSEDADMPDGKVWRVDVYAMNAEDRLALGKELCDSGNCLAEALKTQNKTLIADTSAVNRVLDTNTDVLDSLGLKTAWVEYDDSLKRSLVVYRDSPLLTDTISVVSVCDNLECDDNVTVSFRFADPAEWEIVTRGLVGRRIAVAVNGKVVNTPVVNAPITEGGCTLVLPVRRARRYFPVSDKNIKV